MYPEILGALLLSDQVVIKSLAVTPQTFHGVEVDHNGIQRSPFYRRV